MRAHKQLEVAEQFLQSGKYVEAQDACRELLGEHAEYVGALFTLGRAYVASRNYDAALPCFIRASMLSPGEPSILIQLARNYFNLGAGEAALQSVQDALAMQPDDELAGEAHLLLGQIFQRRSDYEQARDHLEQAQALNPGLSDVAFTLGHCLLELGECDKCATAYGLALEGNLSPMDRAYVLYDLAGIADAAGAENLMSQIDALSDEASGIRDETERVIFDARLNLAKATLLDIQGEQRAAWEAMTAGNAQMREYSAEDCKQASEQDKYALQRVSGWNFAGSASIADGSAPPLSLFLLGAPQAGAAILERLISALEGSRAGHESDIVHAVSARTSNSAGLMTLHFPGQLPAALHEAFTANYADEISIRAPKARIFTITHPGSIPDLGRIAETVPNMRVIFIERDSDDVAHAIFGKLYPQDNNPFAYDMATIREHLDVYAQLIEIWSEHLGECVMRLRYEDMIADPKATLARIAEFCGVPEPKGKLPELGDDRGCAKAYLDYLK